MDANRSTVCYLCGHIIEDSYDKDHVPPMSIFPSEIRRAHHIEPVAKHATHPACNRSYAKDEEYFRQSLGPLAHESSSGRSLAKDIKKLARRPQSRPLYLKVLDEFQEAPGGIVLPPWLIGKRYDGPRIRRVIWKITRGLFLHEKGSILSENLPGRIELFGPKDKPPDLFLQSLSPLPSHGQYSGVFDYKYVELSSQKAAIHGHYWGLLFWDTVLVQRELDKSILQLRESLAFGKEVFLGMGEFWISPVGDRVGWAVQNGPPQR